MEIFSSINVTDPAEAKPELVARAEKIFTESHHPDPQWPLDRLSDALTESRKQAWEITTERRKARWAPENGIPIGR